MTDIEAVLNRSRRERVEAEERLREVGPDGRYDWEPSYDFTSDDRVKIAAAIEVVRRKICLYAGDPCDCKYGVGIKLVGGRPSGEACGCPELRSAIWMLLHSDEVTR